MPQYDGPAPRMRVQIENRDGTWTELRIDNGLSLQVDAPDPTYPLEEFAYSANFKVLIHHRTWNDLMWDLSKRAVRER